MRERRREVDEKNEKRGGKMRRGAVFLVILAFLGAGGVMVGMMAGFNKITGNGANLASREGKIAYGDGISEGDGRNIREVLGDFKSDGDVLMGVREGFLRKEGKNEVLFDILVPVVKFNDERQTVKITEVKAENGVNFESVRKIGATEKVLALEDKYFFDDFESGAKFRYLTLSGGGAEKMREFLVKKVPVLPTRENVLSLRQTGVSAIARRMNAEFRRNGYKDTFTTEIAGFLKSADLTHVSNEVSFVDGCESEPTSTNLCADPKSLEILKNLGVDIVELTGNHNNDRGASRNVKTIDAYVANGMKTFGGGKNAKMAREPLRIEQKGVKIGLLGYNRSTSSVANGELATEELAGANGYDEERAKAEIAELKKEGRIVVVSVQFFECYCYPEYGAEMTECDKPIRGQREFFQHLVDLGADVVIGTQAHQPQTYEIYKGRPIFYGLGNLMFDQTAWPGTRRSLVVTHYFMKDTGLGGLGYEGSNGLGNLRHLQTRVVPTMYDNKFKVRIMGDVEAERFLGRLMK